MNMMDAQSPLSPKHVTQHLLLAIHQQAAAARLTHLAEAAGVQREREGERVQRRTLASDEIMPDSRVSPLFRFVIVFCVTVTVAL